MVRPVSFSVVRRLERSGATPRPCVAQRTALAVLAPWLVLVLLLAGCGAAGATASADGVGPAARLERFEPERLTSRGSRAWRVLGQGLGQRGERAVLRLRARSGTPFHGGTREVLEVPAIVDSGQQARGTLPDPGIPRTWGADVEAHVDLVLASGHEVPLEGAWARLEPTRMHLEGIDVPALRADTPAAHVLGAGFGPPGGGARVRFTSLVGTPFLGGTAASVEVPGRVAAPTQVAFEPPAVALEGAWFTQVTVTLDDADRASSDRWYARFEGPPPRPPFAVRSIVPTTFGSRVPTVFQVLGSELEPTGGRARVVFVAEEGTPFRGGTTDRLEVPAVILGPATVRGLGPLPGIGSPGDPGSATAVVRAHVEVHLPDGRVATLPAGSLAFVPHQGSERVVLNEIDYDQPGVDHAEFIELYNGGDGAADLGRYRIDLINGLGGGATVYRSFDLPAVPLAPGGWFVVAGDPEAVPGTDHVVAPATNLLQNGGPDAVALFRDDQLVDVISYEGDTAAPYVEGSGVGVEDDGNVPGSAIGRFLDGADTARNDADIDARPRTPGSSNTGRSDRLLGTGARGSLVAEGHLLALSPSEGRGVLQGRIVQDTGVNGLAFAPDGRLFATTHDSDGTCDLLALSPDDGHVVLAIGALHLGAAPVVLTDLASDPADGTLLGLIDEGPGRAALVAIDTAQAEVVVRGELALAAGESAGGLAFAPDGTLFATTRGGGARLLVLDPADGRCHSGTALDRDTIVGLAVRPSDGALVAAVADGDALVLVALDGTTTLVGATGVGAVGDLAFAP